MIANWRSEAEKLIDDCVRDAMQYTEAEPDDSETVSNGIKGKGVNNLLVAD